MNRITTLVFASMMLIASSSQANPNHYRNLGHHHHARTEWIGPLVIGSVLGYAIANNRPQPVIVQQPVVIYPNTYPPVPYGYHYEQIVDAGCNCYRWVLIPN